MAVSASDVPGRFDLVLDDGAGNVSGYMLVKDDKTGLFYQPRRASYGTTPTFLERTNVQGDYGDNQQDFWMTFSQKDWSLGEQQRYFRSNDPDKIRRYWAGVGIDVTSTPGQVSMSPGPVTFTGTGTIRYACAYDNTPTIAYCNDTNLYTITQAGTITDLGAHSLAGAPVSMVIDSMTDPTIYISDGTTIRKWRRSAAAFSTFSTSGSYSLAFVNNSLYGGGVGGTSLSLYRWDTSGTRSSLFTWKQADGTTVKSAINDVHPFGGKLAILISNQSIGDRDTLWLYDGTAPAIIAEFPPSFSTSLLCAVNGVLFISGYFSRAIAAGGSNVRRAIYYYSSGTLGILWQSSAWSSSSSFPYMAPWYDGLLIADAIPAGTSTNYLFYNPATGGVSNVASTTYNPTVLASCSRFILKTSTSANLEVWPNQDTPPSSSSISTSLFDGESSLDKYFKAVKVDFDSASNGNGGSVDISYQINTVDGSYTSVQTGATAGTEYTIGQSGRSISIKVTLNKGTSTYGPVLKRIYVRAVPRLQQFRKSEYVLDLSGRNGDTPIQLRDHTLHNKDGLTMAQELRTFIADQTPLTITDRFGTFTGIIEPDNSSIIEIRPEVFQAHVVVREV